LENMLNYIQDRDSRHIRPINHELADTSSWDVIRIEVEAEFKLRLFMLNYKGYNPYILAEEKLKLNTAWFYLYRNEGKQGKYREN
jgi:hypothetical protein